MRTLFGICGATAALLLGATAAPARAPAFAGATIDKPAVLPNFTLLDQSGRPVELASLRDKLVLLTFLYTHCRDVCPLTAENLDAAVSRLGSHRNAVRVLAISVDPRGDTPQAVRRFIRLHRLQSEFHYLIGTRAQLEPIWRAYSVTSVQRAKGDIDHTLYTVLVDRQGKGRLLYDATARPTAIAHDLRLVLGG
jgi:protein SCO1/2